MNKIIIYVFIIFISGCAARGEKFSSLEPYDSAYSTIYIFRQAKLFNSAYCPSMFIDDKKIGCLKNGGFIRYKLEPGEHLLEVRKSVFLVGPEPKINFESKPGEVIFIEWATDLRHATVTPIVSVSANEGFIKIPKEKAVPVLEQLNES